MRRKRIIRTEKIFNGNFYRKGIRIGRFFFDEILNDKNSCFNKKRVLTSQGLKFGLVRKYRTLQYRKFEFDLKKCVDSWRTDFLLRVLTRK